MKDLQQITVIGLGLLGGSICLAVQRSINGVKVVGFSHRSTTRKKARQLAGGTDIVDDLAESVADSDIVILATPIYTFQEIFRTISGKLKSAAVVTDVGSTKVLPHRWAAKTLPENVFYVGSHPIAGSEQRGIEYARDDFFEQADCIITGTKTTNKKALSVLKWFWAKIGCRIIQTSPARHDRIFANISHLPHITASALVNCNNEELLSYAGKGFIDATRVASGPANIWVDVLMANADNCVKGIDNLITQLENFKKAVQAGNDAKVTKLLEAARNKRAKLIKDKITKRELLS